MTEVRFFTTGDGCRIAWCYDGPQDAPLLILSNSLGTDMDMWKPQMAAFAARFRVLRYDQRGHGRSGAPAGAYSMDRLGRDVIELLDALDIATVDFCGLSLGGMVGQWLGIRAPERIGRLILANTSSYMGPPSAWDARIETVGDQGMAPLAEASVARWFTPAFIASGQDAIEPMRRILLATAPQGYAGCCAAIRDMDMRRGAQLIQTPTLIIGGAQDAATPPAHSLALQQAIAGSALKMLDAAHLSNVERETEFALLVSQFLGN